MLSQTEIEQLPPQIRNHIRVLTEQVLQRDDEIVDLQEKLRLALFKKFGRSSEKADELQQFLFSEEYLNDNERVNQSSKEQNIEVPSHKRKKAGRKPLSSTLPRVDVVHDIPEEEKSCGCGHKLSKIDEEVSEKLKIIPEQVFVERHIRPKYACRHCEGSGDEDKPVFRIMPVEPSLIPKSIVSPELLAFIMVNKFCDHLPFYRQEKRFERIGVHISRQDMSNWCIKSYEALIPLDQVLKKQLCSGEILKMDETPVQVLGEDGKANTSESRMWLSRGGPPGKPVIYYDYHPDRKAQYVKDFTADFFGYLQSDGYGGYDSALKDQDNITHVGCMAHVRREFFDSAKASKKAGTAHVAVGKIKEFYRIEKELRKQNLPPYEFQKRRKQLVTPLADDFKEWLSEKSLTVRPTSKTGKAIAYALGQWNKVIRYLDHPDLTPDNNDAENAIRPFVLGRKNWLFSGSPRGAKASCFMFSLIETAKQNGLNPYGYLSYVFTNAPYITDGKNWESLLPWNIRDDLWVMESAIRV